MRAIGCGVAPGCVPPPSPASGRGVSAVRCFGSIYVWWLHAPVHAPTGSTPKLWPKHERI